MKKIYKHGKLLLTAEYAVLDGARALALPTLKGQKFTINPIDQLDIIIWQAFDYMNDLWFWAEICTTNWTVIKTSEARHANRIIQLLKAAKDLNPEFYPQRSGFKVTTELDFPISWGLGSSSTLIAAVADWSENDPHLLSKRSFGGS